MRTIEQALNVSPAQRTVYDPGDQFGEDFPKNILYPFSQRQFVFSIPIMLRIYFKHDQKLLTQLCHCTNESLQIFFPTMLGLDDGILGIIMVIHTFGDYARFHPHLNAILADGVQTKLVLLLPSQN